jgi:hypothetical protein
VLETYSFILGEYSLYYFLLGGLVVIVLASGPNPAKEDGILRAIKKP